MSLERIEEASTLGEAWDLCREFDPDMRSTALLKLKILRQGREAPFTRDLRYTVGPMVASRLTLGPDPEFVYRVSKRGTGTVWLRRAQALARGYEPNDILTGVKT